MKKNPPAGEVIMPHVPKELDPTQAAVQRSWPAEKKGGSKWDKTPAGSIWDEIIKSFAGLHTVFSPLLLLMLPFFHHAASSTWARSESAAGRVEGALLPFHLYIYVPKKRCAYDIRLSRCPWAFCLIDPSIMAPFFEMPEHVLKGKSRLTAVP
eukprot:scaffold27210_cov16-Tisochrysis_lutea.AAC.1